MPIYIGTQEVIPSGISKAYVGETEVYSEEEPSVDEFYILPQSATCTVTCTQTYSESDIEYEVEGTTSGWHRFRAATNNQVTVPYGTKLYLRNSGTKDAYSTSEYTQFSVSGNFSLHGNLKMMTADRGIYKKYSCYKLFSNCTTLTDASDLIIDGTLTGQSALHSTFYGCSSLTKPPKINIDVTTSTATNALKEMFKGVSSTNKTPIKISATYAEGYHEFLLLTTTGVSVGITGLMSNMLYYCSVYPTTTPVKNTQYYWYE